MSTAAPFRIILDHSQAGFSDRLEQALGRTLGRLLIGIGLMGTVVAVPTTIIVGGSIIVGNQGHRAGAAQPSPPELPATELMLGSALSLALVALALKSGLWLVRRDRGIVLFLRRFRYDEASRAVSFAVSRTIGSRWRIVTLDDAEITPIGPSEGARRVFSVGGTAWKRLSSLVMMLGLRLFPLAVLAAGLVVGLEVFTASNSRDLLNDGTVERYLRALTAVLSGHPPIAEIGPSLAGIFALLVTIAAGAFLLMAVTFVASLLAVPLAGVIAFLSASARAVDAAERAKRVDVRDVAELERVANEIPAKARKVLAARLTILRVATAIWQLAVRCVAANARLVIIDVSEVTENVLWEIAELAPAFGARCVLIGQHDRLRQLAAVQHAPDGSLHERFLRLLSGHEILAYTTDTRGITRFACALGATLSHASKASWGALNVQRHG